MSQNQVQVPSSPYNLKYYILDERHDKLSNCFLNVNDAGFVKSGAPVNNVSFHFLIDISSAKDLFGSGYELNAPFLLSPSVLNTTSSDPRVEAIKSAFTSFKTRSESAFGQTREQFLENPQFFNFQNFVDENAFAIDLVQGILDTRGNIIFTGDPEQDILNKKLVLNSFFGDSSNNLNLMRSYWERLLPWAKKGNSNISKTDTEGIKLLVDFFTSTPVSTMNNLNNALIKNPHLVKSESINNYITSINESISDFKLSIRRSVTLPTIGTQERSKFIDDGVLFCIYNPNATSDMAPFISLTQNPIKTSDLSYFPPINNFTYRKTKISQKTILLKDRSIQSPNVGFGKGVVAEIQNRIPISNQINSESNIETAIDTKFKSPKKNLPPQVNLLFVSNGNQNINKI